MKRLMLALLAAAFPQLAAARAAEAPDAEAIYQAMLAAAKANPAATDWQLRFAHADRPSFLTIRRERRSPGDPCGADGR